MQQKQLFIAIEGIDGSGKTTLSKHLTDLCSKQYDVLLTKEPGGTDIGSHLRAMLHESSEKIDKKAQYLLFAADRAQHISHVIQPHLEKGYIVITDRFTDSSLAYQGYGNGISKEIITTINNWTTNHLRPDIIFYIDISVQEALKRLASRNNLSAYENKDFLQRVSSGFHELFKDRKEVVTLDGHQKEDVLVNKAFHKVEQWLNR